MSVASLYTPYFVMFCVFLYGPFCHGAHYSDLSKLFTTFFLWTSLTFILLVDTGHFFIVLLILPYLHCLQHSFFEHLFNAYYVKHENGLNVMGFLRWYKVVISKGFVHYHKLYIWYQSIQRWLSVQKLNWSSMVSWKS